MNTRAFGPSAGVKSDSGTLTIPDDEGSPWDEPSAFGDFVGLGDLLLDDEGELFVEALLGAG
nr:hypothetical protein [Corynebacterium lactis]